MSRFLPLFPLGLVVFPYENLNLHIFEPRYIELINECKNEGKTFGIPPFFNKKMSYIGTEVEVVKIAKRYPDGRLDIKTRGVGLFEINEFHQKVDNKLYAGATVTTVEFTSEGDVMTSIKILDILRELYEVMRVKKAVPDDPATLSTYQIAHHVGFSSNQEIAFLKTTDEKARQQMMLTHLEHMLPIVKETENLRERVRMNGHFKDLIPPDILGHKQL